MLIVDLEMKVVRQDVNDSMAGGRPPAFSATDRGIGHMMIAASSRFDVPLVFAGLLVTAFMGIAMYVVASLIEERMTGWATRSMDPNLSAPPV